jgi:hypothetical protein
LAKFKGKFGTWLRVNLRRGSAWHAVAGVPPLAFLRVLATGFVVASRRKPLDPRAPLDPASEETWEGFSPDRAREDGEEELPVLFELPRSPEDKEPAGEGSS